MDREPSLVEFAMRLERLESLFAGRFPPIGDPAPDDWGRPWYGRRWQWQVPIPIPRPDPGDPVPFDISRLSRVQLQLSLESIKAERIRLDALEEQVKRQIGELG
jgi:hypothetical protein